jgi:hypothetical protein
MPISFEQPVAANFNSIGQRSAQSEWNKMYTDLAQSAQSRFASDRASAGREQLGYAQLESDQALRQQALGLQALEIQQRPELQAQAIQMRARAEMDQWMMQQDFTARDQMELSRQRNSLAELLTKRENGEVSEEEFYQMAGSVAPRLNSLQERQNFSMKKAMEQERKSRAAMFDEQAQYRSIMNAFQRGEFDGQVEVHIPTQHKQFMADYMADAYPGLQPGGEEYEAKLKLDAAAMGKGVEMLKTPKGPVPLSTLKGMMGDGGAGAGGTSGAGASAGQGKPMDEKSRAQIADRAMTAADKFFAEQMKSPTQEEWEAEVMKRSAMMERMLGGGPSKEGAQKMHEEAIGANKVRIDEIRENKSLSPLEKERVSGILEQWQKFADKYGSSPPPAIAEKMNALMTRYQQFKAAVAMREKIMAGKAQPPAPEAAPAQPAPQWGQSLGQDVGNVGRAAGGAVRGTAQEMGEAIRTAPQGIVEAAPLPEAWKRYLLGG